MIGSTHVSRGKRGDYDPHARPGDITGRQFIAQADAKEQRSTALNTTRNALTNGEALELIRVPGGRTFLLPKEVVLYLIGIGADHD